MKKQILDLVEKYVETELLSNKFVPGESVVQYTGHKLDSQEFVAMIGTMLEGWFGLSHKSKVFEEKVAKRLGKKYGVYTNSGSSANLLALETMKEMHSGDKRNKIVVPASSFPTTVNPVLQLGYKPVFVDVDLGTYNMNDTQVREALEDEDVIGVMFAHALGNPVAHTRDYYHMMEERGGFLIEDCCDALGGIYHGELVGTFSHVSTLSLYVAHHMTTGEGGMVAFQNKKEEIVARSYRDWGRGCFCSGKEVLSEDGACQHRFADWLNNGHVTDHRYVYERIGYNLKPLEFQAAMGLVQIEKLDTFIEQRKNNFNKLYTFLKQYEEFLILPKAEENTDPSWFAFPITVREEVNFDREQIVKYLESRKVQTRNYFAGNVLDHPGYRNYREQATFPLQQSSMVTNNTFMVGVYPGISDEMYQYMFTVFSDFFNQI